MRIKRKRTAVYEYTVYVPFCEDVTKAAYNAYTVKESCRECCCCSPAPRIAIKAKLVVPAGRG